MLDKLASEMQHLVSAMQHNLLFSLKIIAILWCLHLLNWILRYGLNAFGIRPREACGLPGILFAPFLHGDFNHLFFNSIPLFVLSDLILVDGKFLFYWVSGAVTIIAGFLVWIFGKRGIHIGASSLIMGFFGYLLARAYFQLTAVTVVLAIFCIYYFGGLFTALFPSAKKNISWEGHVFGFIAGIATAYSLPTVLWFLGY